MESFNSILATTSPCSPLILAGPPPCVSAKSPVLFDGGRSVIRFGQIDPRGLPGTQQPLVKSGGRDIDDLLMFDGTRDILYLIN